MTPEPTAKQTGRTWIAIIVIAIVAALSFSTTANGARHRFFASLRMQKPQPVNVNIPSFSGPNANRQLQDMIGGMLSKQANVTLDEKDQPVTGADAASTLAGFAVQLPAARKDAPTLIVMGAHAVDITVDRTQLKTIFEEAGKPNVVLSASLDGALFTIRTPRAIRAQYGNCPVPVANTIQNQIQGAPPPSTDNGNCIVLIQGPAATADVPAGLDLEQLAEIALELSGMSPKQAEAFQKTLDAKSTLVLSMPRNMRSWAPAELSGATGILVNTAGRRGPTYALIWAKAGIVYSLLGYGSPGDAVPLANSLH